MQWPCLCPCPGPRNDSGRHFQSRFFSLG
jgi:hypothetical protein